MASRNSPKTFRWYLRRMWRDLLSVYYANTPIWRWLKSGALIFLGFFLWTGGAVLLSVQPEWELLHYVMAYGFLLLFWGPFTHLVVVPMTIRLRRNATHPVARAFSRNSGKINLTIFFAFVIALGAVTPGIMLLDFAPILEESDRVPVQGDLLCDVEGNVVSCEVANAQGFDHVVATAGGEVIATAEEPPYAFEVHTDDLEKTRTGKEFIVDYRDEDGETVRRFVRQVA